ncbi:hypothetical protein DPX16_3726 [Anabarilius grahami]|uniref:Uncharacterized protein n=1 Tax=Anabarilius grahami TaxID=495550 RepID=A0A3N0YP63_ANAGA|nr:hypothetical protein DPX16_3726 [Anabarilius grahami]
MSKIQLFPSDDESLISQESSPHPSHVRSTRAPPDVISESPEPLRGRQPIRATSRTPRRRGLPLPPPTRQQSASPASSYASAHPTIPAIEKWTVVSLRQALISADIHFSRRMNKAQLYDLYVSLQSTFPSPKSTSSSKNAKAHKSRKAPSSRPQKTPSPSLARPALSRASGRGSRPSASLGRAPDSAAARPNYPLPSTLPAGSSFNVSMTPLETQAQPSQSFSHAVSNPPPCPWPAAPSSDPSARLPPLAAQAQTHYSPSQPNSFSNIFAPPQALGADPSVRLPPLTAPTPTCYFPSQLPLFPNTFAPPQAPGAVMSPRLPQELSSR